MDTVRAEPRPAPCGVRMLGPGRRNWLDGRWRPASPERICIRSAGGIEGRLLIEDDLDLGVLKPEGVVISERFTAPTGS